MGKIKRMRKLITDKKWLNKKLDRLAQEDRELNTFRQFECSDFFRGKITATRNYNIYLRKLQKLNRQVSFIEQQLNATK